MSNATRSDRYRDTIVKRATEMGESCLDGRTVQCADAVSASTLRVDQSARIGLDGNISALSTDLSALVPKAAVGMAMANLLHINDRVTFLNAVADLRDGNISVKRKNMTVLLDVSQPNEPQRYASIEVEIARNGVNSVAITAYAKCETSASHAPNTIAANAIVGEHLLAMISHELRTPLNAILGFSDVLRGELSEHLPAEKRREYGDLIHGAGEHLLSLVNTILDVSKIQSGTYRVNCEPFDFNAVVRESVDLVRAQCQDKSIHINERLVGDFTQVIGDRRAIKQILINLLSNAVKFTPKGGCITIDASVPHNGFRFAVSDTGVGMTDEQLQHVGTPFYQADNGLGRNHEGTGLGLSMVTGLIDLHHGSIDVVSAPNIGTQVNVFIPVAPSRLTDLTKRPDTHRPQPTGARKSA